MFSQGHLQITAVSRRLYFARSAIITVDLRAFVIVWSSAVAGLRSMFGDIVPADSTLVPSGAPPCPHADQSGMHNQRTYLAAFDLGTCSNSRGGKARLGLPRRFAILFSYVDWPGLAPVFVSFAPRTWRRGYQNLAVLPAFAYFERASIAVARRGW
ncbi:hypothetical protein FIBSPDRAFT_1019235 [Athelia psychrophila]|uniref:Uncharacterized protein n=1 Tax=Athelia psychrophila TaxID=1759441 RepID=A0A166KDZ3_9AGAM|nr:hypothetical protein FIBSPDRAFT_1019235 [Fibularhizoctonia sp. CBS 109695]